MDTSKQFKTLTTGIVGARVAPRKESLAAKLIRGDGFIGFLIYERKKTNYK
jgi:hypothetical protein